MRRHRSPRIGGIFDWFRQKAPPPPIQPSPGVDYYAVFGVPPDASMDEIRAAYRRRAAPLHPDRRPGDAEAARIFHQLNEAYQILSDPERRSAYDRLRPARPMPLAPRPAAGPPALRPELRPAPPAFFAAFETRTGMAPPRPTSFAPGRPAPPAPPAVPPPKPQAIWEALFRPPEPSGPRGAETVFAPFAARPATPPPPAAALPAGPSPLPDVEEMAEWLFHTWPLEFIWDVALSFRDHPDFRASGLMIVDRVAGFDPRIGIEYELAEALGIPPSIVDDHSRRGLLTTGFWRDILYPLFERMTAAMDMLKPRDIPGRFALDWDTEGTGIDLLYFEETGRRPWK
jgi:hypothetical protein